MKKIGDLKDLTREEWLEFRRQYIGGSDAAAILGLNKYKSPLAIWTEKKGLKGEDIRTEATRQGTDLEAYVADRFAEQTGKQIENDTGIYVDEERPWMGADIDRMVVGESAILECKTTQNRAGYRFDDGELPPSWYVQVMHYMSITGRQKAYVAILEFGRSFNVITVDRNEDEIAALRQVEERFWKDHVEADVPPDPDGTASAAAAVQQMWPDGIPGETAMLYDMEDTFEALNELTVQREAIQHDIDELKQKICMEMGTAESGCSQRWKATWKTSKRTTLDTARLREENPQIWQKYSKTTTGRTFRFGRIKEEIE